MMETTWAGEEKVTPEVTPEELGAAVANPNNERVEVFRPGMMARQPGGQLCVRGEDGHWYRVTGRCAKVPPFPALLDKLREVGGSERDEHWRDKA
jgi:hypothetical protein